MKNLSLLAISAASLLVINGCKSTNNELAMENGAYVYPSMPIIQASQYVWDDKISEALNVVNMAKPAGVGLSLRDYEDGKNASIGEYGGLSGLFDATLGLMSGGLFTVVQGEALRTGANRAVEFTPTIVDVANKSEVYVNGKPSYKKVRDRIAKKAMLAIEKTHSSIEWGGVYSIYNGDKRHDVQLIINSEDDCKKARSLLLDDENAKPFMTRNFAEIFIDGENETRDYCSFGFYINTTFELTDDKIAIVAELKNGPLFAESIINSYDGYVIVPDFYAFNHRTAARTDYAFVSKNGTKLLFQKP